MIKVSTLASAVTLAVSGLTLSGAAQANFTGDMSRIDANQLSGNESGTVNANCSVFDGEWGNATAKITSTQAGGTSRVTINVHDAKPDTHMTLWVRLKGQSHGEGFGGSPITGGGATPLAPGSALDDLVADWTGSGSTTGANSFTTDAHGNGVVHINLDFALEGGAYPFNKMSAASLAAAEAKRGIDLVAAPTAIVNPGADNVGPSGTPFLIRMVSHCQGDKQGHGLSPSKREPWFQYP